MRRVLLAVSVISIFLAGCADAPEHEEEQDGGDGTGFPPLEPPEWAVGDWWNYTFVHKAGAFSLVVTEVASEYFVATDNRGSAFYDARTDISYLGAIGKDLSGSQGDNSVQFFDWPLTHDKTWVTRWDNEDIEITAHRVDATTFHLIGENATGRPWVTYVYDAEVGHIAEMVWLDSSGDGNFGWKIASSGDNFGGTVVAWELQSLGNFDGAFSGVTSTQFEVASGMTDVYVQWNVTCTTGNAYWEFAPITRSVSEGEGIRNYGPCPWAHLGAKRMSVDPAGEHWIVNLAGDPTAVGHYSVQAWARLLIESSVG